MDENISRAAGASHGQGMAGDDFPGWWPRSAGPSVQRTTLYGPVRVTAVPPGGAGRRYESPARGGRSSAAYPGAGRRPPAVDVPSRRPALGDASALGRWALGPRGRRDVGDLKIADAALAEMTEAFRVFRPYRRCAR